jgi:YVTN family beta-propeller protein
VTVIDGTSNLVITTLVTGSQPCVSCLNPRNDKVCCLNSGSDDVTVIDGIGDSVIKVIIVGSGPCASVCNPAQNRVYVANYWSNTISVIRDTATGIDERPFAVRGRQSLEVYPNPFRDRVTLRLPPIADHSSQELRICNMSGQVVQRFEISQSAVRNPQWIVWDGRDGLGRCVAPGCYFCILRSPTGVVRTKVILGR